MRAGMTLQTNMKALGVYMAVATAIPHQIAPTKLKITAPYVRKANNATIGGIPMGSTPDSASPQNGIKPARPGKSALSGMRAADEKTADVI
jgi:hypothetical protein